MKLLDLFSGVGSFSLAAQKFGIETVLFCDNEPHAQQILKKNFAGVPIHDDITTLSLSEGFADIITGGFPCQDISVANPSGLGLQGSRSGLWSEYNRVIQEVKPKYVVIENSPNLRNKGLEYILKDLWESGYDAEWYCLEAGQFGAAHVRERILIIAYPIGTRGERLVKDEYFKEIGQGGLRSKTDLLDAIRSPFERSYSWPKPLLRRGIDGTARRLDRLARIGNSVDLRVSTFIMSCIYRAENE